MWGELARLGGLAHLGEIIFIPRSYVHMESYISFQSKSLLYRWKKIVWPRSFLSGFKILSIFCTEQWRKVVIQNKCSYII